MTIKEAYEKWKHLDKVLSDKDFCDSSPVWGLAYDLWQAVKEEVEKQS